MIPHKTKLFCITVHFGSQQPTNRLLRQLGAQNSAISGLVIVDNARDPYPPPAAPFPIQVVKTGDNLGYAAGINAGMRELRTYDVHDDDLVMCCNNDVEITASGVSQIFAWWERKPSRLLAGAKIGQVNLITGRAHVSAPRDVFSPTISYVHGSCFIATYATWRALGNLPEKFFMYWEDVALSIRAHAAAISLRQLPEGIIGHNDLPKRVYGQKLYYLVRNGAFVLESATPTPWRNYWQAANTIRHAWHTLLGNKETARALRDRKQLWHQ